MIGNLDKSIFDPEKNYDEFYQDHKFEPMIEELSYVADEVIPRVAWAVDVAREIGAKKVLDLCCLDGFALLTLANRIPALSGVGVDLSHDGIQLADYRASQRGFHLVFMERAVETITIDGEADLVLLFEAIEHFTDVDKVMAVIKKSLKPGGTLLVSTPDAEGVYGIGNDDACHLQIYTHRSFRHLWPNELPKSEKPVYSLPDYLESQGFEVVEGAVWNSLCHVRAVLK